MHVVQSGGDHFDCVYVIRCRFSSVISESMSGVLIRGRRVVVSNSLGEFLDRERGFTVCNQRPQDFSTPWISNGLEYLLSRERIA